MALYPHPSDQFWNLIEQARPVAEDPHASADPERLAAVLAPLEGGSVATFRREYVQALFNLYDWKVWNAGYLMVGGMSDDSFHYFRDWIIGRGKAAYETALSRPDDLGDYIGEYTEVENELLGYVSVEILEQREIEDPADDIEYPEDPAGEPFDEDEPTQNFPKLTARFWG